MTKKIITIIIFTIAFLSYTSAQTAEYTYRPLAAEGCSMKYCVAKQGEQYYIIATVSSDRMRFLKESCMLIRTFDGNVIKLDGCLLDNDTQSSGIIVGNVVVPVTGIISSAQFKISEAELQQLECGISKIRLTTIPIEHERTFKKDKIGNKIYKLYLQVKNKNTYF